MHLASTATRTWGFRSTKETCRTLKVNVVIQRTCLIAVSAHACSKAVFKSLRRPDDVVRNRLPIGYYLMVLEIRIQLTVCCSNGHKGWLGLKLSVSTFA